MHTIRLSYHSYLMLSIGKSRAIRLSDSSDCQPRSLILVQQTKLLAGRAQQILHLLLQSYSYLEPVFY